VSTVAADAAPAVLLLRVEGWGVQPRIGIALDGLRAAPRAEPAPVPLAITKGRLTKIRKVPYLEVSTNAPFNWTDAFAEDRVEVRDGNGKPLPGGTGLAFEFVDRDTLRIEVPETWSKPLTVVLSGLRAPDGSVYAAPEPFVVR